MPKRTEVVEKITKAAKKAGLSFDVQREGGNHTIYNLNGLIIPIARHQQLDGYLAIKIYKQCEPKLGKGWWR
ncbi:hypothetical protein H7I87_09690 [Mycobacterium timonense]|uniref:Addiction module toxin, HicA family n=1 Tax=Mycobacterium bouchedurhonense TaxID=701041 RepID=A0AAW5SAF3_MYCBC|nr:MULTISPECIES: hypothetical protein [Mycobacterium avium complex (MAC)]EUA36575.1 ycfA-like family protein [Mycobacterium avium subsp. avium 2285 (R)]MCV6991599.1 hypothetical protein [Mycobacterium bouchedurhonense]MCV6994996.1 hypothetical protein [Mycobacterium timonense]ORA36004.1 hypothetical protein BST19_28430 [Mycobacterium bouchedurhonense]